MADETKLTKDDLDAAVKAATDKLQETIDKLESKNDGLLDDLKKAQREARAAKDVKPEDLHAAEDRAEKAEARIKELEGSVKTLTSERDKAVKALEAETALSTNELIGRGITEALVANGVKDEDFISSLTAQFRSGTTVKVEGDKRVAMHGDKPLAEFIKEWAGSDAGKKFVTAPTNSGGGASGGQAKGDVQTITRAAYDVMDQQAKGEAGLRMAKGELKIADAA